MVKASIKLDIVTVNPETVSPMLLTVKLEPDREQVRLPTEQVVLDSVVISLGKVIVRLVNEELSKLSNENGAVMVRVILDG